MPRPKKVNVMDSEKDLIKTLPDVVDVIEEPEFEEKEYVHFNELRWLTDTYMQSQKIRIASQNRVRALEQQVDQGPETVFLNVLLNRFAEIEKDITKQMTKVLKHHPAWPWLTKVKGVGPTLATKLLGLIPEDISSFTTVSKLWRYAGLAVIDGKAERPKKGEKLHYNVRLKTVMYLIAGSMIKSKSPYRLIYDRAKSYYQQTRPEWTKAHIHMASIRKMQKVFLCHLWEEWRTQLNLPTREIYVIEVLGHEMKYHRDQFVDHKVKA